MSNSTHEAGVVEAIGWDCGRATSWTSLHLSRTTEVDGDVRRDAGLPYVLVHLGGHDETARTSVFIQDADLLDRLINMLTEARAEFVNALLADAPKAG